VRKESVGYTVGLCSMKGTYNACDKGILTYSGNSCELQLMTTQTQVKLRNQHLSIVILSSQLRTNSPKALSH